MFFYIKFSKLNLNTVIILFSFYFSFNLNFILAWTILFTSSVIDEIYLKDNLLF